MTNTLGPAQRGVSAVIGTVLLVGIVTIIMAIIAVAILGIGFFDQTPDADLVYQEEGNDEITVAIENIRADNLEQEETELMIQGEDDTQSWGTDGLLEQGDSTNVTSSDLAVEEGETLQVIGGNTILDTYEIRGLESFAETVDECENYGRNNGWVFDNVLIDCPIDSVDGADEVKVIGGSEVKYDVGTDDSTDTIIKDSEIKDEIDGGDDGDVELVNSEIGSYVETSGSGDIDLADSHVEGYTDGDDIDLTGSHVEGDVDGDDIDLTDSHVEGEASTGDGGDITITSSDVEGGASTGDGGDVICEDPDVDDCG